MKEPSLYTNQVREYVHSRDWPKGLQFTVVERLDGPPGLETPVLYFVFNRPNWVTLEPQSQFKTAMVVKEVMEKLRADGIPCYMEAMRNETD